MTKYQVIKIGSGEDAEFGIIEVATNKVLDTADNKFKPEFYNTSGFSSYYAAEMHIKEKLS